MRYRSLLLCVMVVVGGCTVSTAVDKPSGGAAADAPVEVAEPNAGPAAEPAPELIDEAPDDGVDAVDPAIGDFLREPELNALGEPMILVLEPRRAIPRGTRVSELLADPSRYFEIRQIDPSETGHGTTDYAASAASYAWLQERPNMIVDAADDGPSRILWKFQIVEEEIVDVLVAAGDISDGTSFAQMLDDLDGWTRTERRPAWQVRQEQWLSTIDTPVTTAQFGGFTAVDLADYSECAIDGDLNAGDPIAFQGSWYWGSQQLQVVETIPVGLTVAELVSAPTVFLSAQIEVGCRDRTLGTIAALQELSGQVALQDIEVGTNLDVSQFGEPSALPVGVSVLPTPVPPTPTPRPTVVVDTRVEVYVAVQDLPVGLSMAEVLQDPESYLVVIKIEQADEVQDAVGPINGAVREGEPYSMIDHFLSRCVVAEPIAAGEQLLLPRTWLRRVYVSRAVAAGTTVAEITRGLTAADADIRLSGQSETCGIEDDDFLVDVDQVRALDPSLVLNRVITPEDPLQFSFFSPPG